MKIKKTMKMKKKRKAARRKVSAQVDTIFKKRYRAMMTYHCITRVPKQNHISLYLRKKDVG